MTTITSSTKPWPWPDDLDALTAAANHHTLLLENDRVRIVETLVPAGERTTVHTHRWPGALHILSWSNFIRRDAEDVVLLDTRNSDAAPPAYQWSDPLPPHSLENVGNRPLRVVSVEVKS